MIVVTVARKPLCGSVASNVLEHGAGALNVDGCRIGTAEDTVHAVRRSDYPQSYDRTEDGEAGWGRIRGGLAGDEVHWTPRGGRWPANLVLQHAPTCRQVGTKDVKVVGATAHRKDHATLSEASIGTQAHEHFGFRNANGTETVVSWECAGGCPVAALDAQTGQLAAQGSPKKKDTGEKSFLGTGHGGVADSTFYGDVGGASRFFKQVGGKKE